MVGTGVQYPAFPRVLREGRGEVSTVACDPAGLGEFTARGGSFEIALEGIRDGRSGRGEYRDAERHRLERVEHREHEGQGEQGVHRRFSYGFGLNGAGPSSGLAPWGHLDPSPSTHHEPTGDLAPWAERTRAAPAAYKARGGVLGIAYFRDELPYKSNPCGMTECSGTQSMISRFGRALRNLPGWPSPTSAWDEECDGWCWELGPFEPTPDEARWNAETSPYRDLDFDVVEFHRRLRTVARGQTKPRLRLLARELKDAND